MDKFFLDLGESIGGQWLAILLGALWLIYKSGVVQRFLGVIARAPEAERLRLSLDQQLFIENLHAEIGRLDRRITIEREACDRQLAEATIERNHKLAELRAECDADMRKLSDTITRLAAGESRWRHLTGNLAQYVAALQAQLRKAQIEVPRFTGWDTFIADGGEPFAIEGDDD